MFFGKQPLNDPFYQYITMLIEYIGLLEVAHMI